MVQLLNKKGVVLVFYLMMSIFLFQIVSADVFGIYDNDTDFKECIVKTSDTVLSNSPREAWTDALFEEEMAGNTKQGYVVSCKSPTLWDNITYFNDTREVEVCIVYSGFLCIETELQNETFLNSTNNPYWDIKWGSSEKDPNKFAVIQVPTPEYNESWLEPEYDYANPTYDCGYLNAQTCIDSVLDVCGGDLNCQAAWINHCNANCNGVIIKYPIKTERKYKMPLESFIPSGELTTLKETPCSDTSLKLAISKEISDPTSLIIYNNWSLKPFEWVRPGDPSCDFYASLGEWYVNGTFQLVSYPQYNGDREKVIILDVPIMLTSDDISIQMPAGIMIKSIDLFWDGTITLPTAKENATALPPEENKELKKIFEVGFANAHLFFDRAVKLTIPDEAGSLIGYSRPGEAFTQVITTCVDNTQATNDLLGKEGECKIDAGSDLVVWTKHFTEFVAYELDLDNDGVFDGDDLCLETPEGEEVNTDGCSCSQIEIPFRDCTENQCMDENWVVYPEDGYDTCVAGVITAEYSCGAISSIYDLECDPDDDDDDVLDEEDKCAGTIEWNALELKPNHYDSGNIDLTTTFGCSCEQILECKPGKNKGEYKFGCSKGTMNVWTLQKAWAPDCQGLVGGKSKKVRDGEQKDFFENTDDGGLPDIIDGDNDNDGVSDSEDDMEDDRDENGNEGHGKPDWWEQKHPGR